MKPQLSVRMFCRRVIVPDGSSARKGSGGAETSWTNLPQRRLCHTIRAK
jgi:hypothetical protein